MDVLDAERMQAADRHAIETLGIPGLVLMENAGRLVAETILDEFGPADGRAVCIVAGPGNNGGDGFVVARHLAARGADVEVLLVGRPLDGLTGDAALMARSWGGATTECTDEAAWRSARGALSTADVVVDALFGTGLSRPATGLAAAAIASINEAGVAGAHVVAVDLPSGLSGSSAAVPGPAVRADLTVTFARPKIAHLLAPAEDLCGDVVVADIGIPDASIRSTAPDLHWVLPEDATALLPFRDPEDHKGSVGHVGVVAGSAGRAGAAALTAVAALRAGAGLVTAAAPASVRAEVASFAAELMTEPLPCTDEGGLGAGAGAAALERLERATVLAVGPGLGTAASAAGAVQEIVRAARVPVVLDADGLNAFAGDAAALAKRGGMPLVITPHPGEAARLAGSDTHAIQADRLAAARSLARDADAVCVLKGHRTIVAAPDGAAFINPTGNPGLATAGAGDALTGLVAGLLAQGLDPLDAAILGSFVHGLAADLAVSGDQTEMTLTAGDVIESFADAIRLLAGAADEHEGDDEGTSG